MYGPRSSDPEGWRGVSLLLENEEYLWAALGLQLDRSTWHYVRRLQIRVDGSVTF
jgi:hypothetical protein